MMTTNQNTQTWEVELLTPLHIGDGVELRLNEDYVSKTGSMDVIEFDSLLESLSEYPLAINDLGKTIDLQRLMKNYRINAPVRYSLPIKGVTIPNSIRRFLKNAYGQPYMAGSSLKGAIHTALWTTLDKSRLPSPQKFRDFSAAVKSIGGKDPYHMFIRPLQISDSIGIEPGGALNCEEIKFFNLQMGNRPGWKDFRDKRTKDKFQDAAGLFVECLKPGIKLCLQAKLDHFLNSPKIKKAAGITECSNLSQFQTLLQAMNAHSLHLATREQAFFSGYKTETASVMAFYDKLIYQIQALGQDSGTAFLRLSWGSGWRGMTGDWIDDDTLKEVRTQKKLGRTGVDIFPKTRRLAMDTQKGTPCLPLGWIRIQPVEKKKFSLSINSAASAIPESSPQPLAVASVPTPPPDPEAEYQEKLTQFQNNVEKCRNFQGDIGRLAAIVNTQKDDRLKQAMCMVLKKKAEVLPKKAFTKAINENKSWATTLKMLLDANEC
jgi:CRISPR/Cas system CSM-associated protein Csm5 (group 7 of RAMP superfamily)